MELNIADGSWSAALDALDDTQYLCSSNVSVAFTSGWISRSEKVLVISNSCVHSSRSAASSLSRSRNRCFAGYRKAHILRHSDGMFDLP